MECLQAIRNIDYPYDILWCLHQSVTLSVLRSSRSLKPMTVWLTSISTRNKKADVIGSLIGSASFKAWEWQFVLQGTCICFSRRVYCNTHFAEANLLCLLLNKWEKYIFIVIEKLFLIFWSVRFLIGAMDFWFLLGGSKMYA